MKSGPPGHKGSGFPSMGGGHAYAMAAGGPRTPGGGGGGGSNGRTDEAAPSRPTTPLGAIRPTPPAPAPAGGPDDDESDPGLEAGTQLGKYQILRKLGRGGMGSVYEAVHTGISKAVALKTLSKRLASESRAQTRFLREAAAASRLDHPHVVAVTDFGSDDGVIYLVMELLRGEDLGQMLVREGGLSIERTADIMLAVCAGVFAAHQAGVIHRDLKPGNIFLARTPVGEVVPKVLDFGISKLVDEEVRSNLTGTGTVVGTTQYLSPEQVSGHPIDPRSDQYTVGVILYECVTGRNPHDGETLFAVMRSIAEARFRPPRQVRPDIPPTFEALILRAMRTDPAERYESVHSLGCALLPFATSKRRVLWADYFQGTGTGVPTGPVPVTPGSGPGPYQYLAIAHDTPPGAGQAAPTAPPPGMPPEPATPRMPPRPWPQQRPSRPLADWEPVDLAPRGMSWGKIIFIVGALTAVAVGAYRYFGPGATPPPVDPAASTSPTIPLPTTPTPTSPEQPAGAAPRSATVESPEATAPVQPAPPSEAQAVPPPVPTPETQVATPPAPPAPPAAGEAAPATAPAARDRTRTKRRPPRPRQPQSGGAPILD